MSTFRDEFIVIKSRDFLEADKFLTCISKNNGKFEAIAKGVRKIKSRKAGNIGFLKHSKGMFAQGRKNTILTEVELISDPQLDSHDYTSLQTYFQIGEITDRLLPDGHETKNVFEALRSVIGTEEITVREYARIWYGLFLLKEIGYELSNRCVLCEKILREGGGIVALRDMVGFSDGCSSQSGVEVSSLIYKIIRYFAQQNLNSSLCVTITPPQKKVLQKIIIAWIEGVIGYPLKTKVS